MQMATIHWEEIWRLAISEFPLQGSSIHCPDHWRRVEQNGLMLAASNGADVDIVRLFAVLHDSKRWNENMDPEHGPRGARFAVRLRGELFEMDDERFEILTRAIERHADGLLSDDGTIGTCWDADRLDLGRVGMKPAARLLSTDAARKFIAPVI